MGRMSLRGGGMNVNHRKKLGDSGPLEYNEGKVSGDTDVRFMSAHFQRYSYSVISFPMLPWAKPLPLVGLFHWMNFAVELLLLNHENNICFSKALWVMHLAMLLC